ncbi:MAG: TetR/AcrR family transcriptional regulator [Acidimicrobiales bacterium]
MKENSVTSSKDVAARVAANTLAKRGPHYTDEVRRLLDAAFAVMGEHGTTARVRVADIVARAGMSNDTFYRHFPSKDALVVALLEDGTERLASYIHHQMGKEATPQGKVRRWVEGVMSQTRGEAADTTLAVLWNGSSVGAGVTAGRHDASVPLGTLLVEPFTALGSATPEMDASLAAHATLGKVSDYLWSGKRPNREEIERITEFCIDAATPRPATQ